MTITVVPGQSRLPVAKIESPVDGTSVVGNSPVRGYAYANDLRILEVDVIVDGTTYGQAAYGLRRDDICATLNPRPLNCPNIGFSFTLNSINGLLLPNGPHSLQVRVLDESGRFTVFPETAITINVNNIELRRCLQVFCRILSPTLSCRARSRSGAGRGRRPGRSGVLSLRSTASYFRNSTMEIRGRNSVLNCPM